MVIVYEATLLPRMMFRFYNRLVTVYEAKHISSDYPWGRTCRQVALTLNRRFKVSELEADNIPYIKKCHVYFVGSLFVKARPDFSPSSSSSFWSQIPLEHPF